jgi:hypothetical protein
VSMEFMDLLKTWLCLREQLAGFGYTRGPIEDQIHQNLQSQMLQVEWEINKRMRGEL